MLKYNNVSKEHAANIFRVERLKKEAVGSAEMLDTYLLN
jgi:hypothetical protein